MPSLHFGALPRSDVVIFDAEGAAKLAETALQDIPHFVLECRLRTLHTSIGVLYRTAANILRLRSTRRGQLFTAYLLACLQRLRPRVVITYIDNSEFFHSLSALYPKAVFIAVQNGFRSEISVSRASQMEGGWLPEKPRIGSVIRLPHFLCFGQREQDLYRRLGHEVKVFHPAGSLRAGHYKSLPKSTQPAESEYDICLVSEWAPAIMEQGMYPSIRKGLERLNKNLARYVKERPARLAIAGRTNEDRERDAFRDIFGADAVFVPNDPAVYSSYRLMDRSDLIVTLYSTLAFEAFGWGCKTLFCNLSGDPALSCPLPGLWSFSEQQYEAFRDRLDQLRARSRENFQRESTDAARYMMTYNPARPAHAQLRELVTQALEGKIS